MACCQYEIEYSDALSYPYQKLFKCYRGSLPNDKLCLFHSRFYLKGKEGSANKEIAIKAFKARIKDQISKGKKIECIGYYLPDIKVSLLLSELGFEKLEFKIPLYLSKCTFQQLDFSNITFSRGVNFHGAKFSKVVKFYKAEFEDIALFLGAEFFVGVTFTFAKFSHLANFSNVKFNKGTSFSMAEFSDYAFFSQATFEKMANFYGTIFIGDASFEDCKFSSAKFCNADFLSGAYFSRSKFLSLVRFDSAIMSNALFTNAIFHSFASFVNTTFLGEYATNFDKSIFLDKADFFESFFLSDATFIAALFKRVSFSEAEFSNSVTFKQSQFSDEAEFSNTIFCSDTDFHRSIFSNIAYFSAIFKAETYFNYIIFDKPGNIIFEIEDMSKVSFLNTDITKIKFGSKTKWGKNDFKVIEEEWFEIWCNNIPSKESVPKEKNFTVVNFDDVLSVYRNLRDNYEFRRRYDEAGQFFIREMELKRKYKPINSQYDLAFPFKQKALIEKHVALTGLYYHLSRYGEDLLRPTLVGIVIVFLSTVFFVAQSDPKLIPAWPISFLNHQDTPTSVNYTFQPAATTNTASANKDLILVNSTPTPTYSTFVGLDKAADLNQWQKAFERSMVDFIPLLPSGGDIKIGLIDYIIKIVGGAVTFGLIAIALKRRFERKYYH